MAHSRQLTTIFLIIFVNLLGFGIIIPLLPFYGDQVGATPLQIGFLFASYSICQIVASPVLGNLSDRHGRRPILLVSLLGTVVSFILLALADTLLLLFIARIVDGLSGGNISTARAYISDITEKKDRARAYGVIGAAFGLGFVFGPALGGLLGRIDYAAPAWGAAGLSSIALGLTFLWLPETTRRAGAAPPAMWREIPRVLARPVLGRLLLLDLFYWASFAVYQTTFALFAKIRFGFGISEVGYLLALLGFLGALIQGGLVGRVVHHLGEKNTLIAGLVLAALGLGLASFARSVPLFVVALIPAAVGAAVSSPALIALISQLSGREEQGRIQGVSGALESSGRALGPIWGNGLLGLYGEGVAYFSAAVMLLLLAWLGTRLDVPSSGRPTGGAGRAQRLSPVHDRGTAVE